MLDFDETAIGKSNPWRSPFRSAPWSTGVPDLDDDFPVG